MPELTQEQLDEIVKRAVDQATSDLQERLAKTEKNRDSILAEKRALGGGAESDRVMRAPDRYLNEGKMPSKFPTADRVVFKKGGSPQEYQEAKALAAERGVPWAERRRDAHRSLVPSRPGTTVECHGPRAATRAAQRRIEQLENEILEDPLFDEDEII